MKMLPDSNQKPGHEVHSTQNHGETAPKAEDHGGHAAAPEASPTRELVLRIDSIPQGAKVEVGGVYAGVTPLDVKLPESKKEALLALEGYEVYRREVPSAAEAEGAELNWKITLKGKPAEVVAQKAPAAKPLKHAWLRGSKGPYFIQIKAAPESDGRPALESQIADYRSVLGSEKIVGCLVNLGKRGKWYRLLAGPFNVRAEADKARLEWAAKKPEFAEAFVTGRQSCI